MGFIENVVIKLKKILKSGSKSYKMPYILKVNMRPFRLKAKQNNSVNLEIIVKNVSDEEKLTSVKVKTSRWLGTDATLLKKEVIVKLGKMQPDELKTVNVRVHGSSATPQGNHSIAVLVLSHFRDYDQFMNIVRKKIQVRAT